MFISHVGSACRPILWVGDVPFVELKSQQNQVNNDDNDVRTSMMSQSGLNENKLFLYFDKRGWGPRPTVAAPIDKQENVVTMVTNQGRNTELMDIFSRTSRYQRQIVKRLIQTFLHSNRI